LEARKETVVSEKQPAKITDLCQQTSISNNSVLPRSNLSAKSVD